MITKDFIFQAIRFGLVGGFATVLHYGLYWILKQVVDYNIAYTIGYFTAFIANYLLTSFFTFKKKTTVRNGIGFGGAHLCNYLIQLVLLNGFIYLGVSSTMAPIPTYAISIPINFLMVRFVFNHSKS